MSKSTAQHRVLCFGEFVLDLDRGTLERDGNVVPLRPQAFEVLRILVEHSGRLVTKAELHHRVWNDRPITDDSLTHCMIDIRKALGETGHEIVKTVPKRGYLLDRPVKTPLSSNRLFTMPAATVGLALTLLIAMGVALIATHGETEQAPSVPNGSLASLIADIRIGNFFLDRGAQGDLDRANTYFRNALRIAPDNPDALTGLAFTQAMRLDVPNSSETELRRSHEQTLHRLLELDSGNVDAHVLAARFYRGVGNIALARHHFDNAMNASSPTSALHDLVASEAASAGRFAEAVVLQESAVLARPLSKIYRTGLVMYLMAAQRFERAKREISRIRELDPMNTTAADELLGCILILQQRFPESLTFVERRRHPAYRSFGLAVIYEALGETHRAQSAIADMIAHDDPMALIHRAEYHAYRGDNETAFSSLASAAEQFGSDLNDPQYRMALFRSRISPYLGALRQDDRWAGFMDATELPPLAGSSAPRNAATIGFDVAFKW